MPTVSLRSVALSLTFHGVLLGVAAREPETSTHHARAGVSTPLEGTIRVDSAGPGGDPVRDSAPAAATPEHTLERPSLTARRTPALIAASLSRPKAPRELRVPTPPVPPAGASSAAVPPPSPRVAPSPTAAGSAPPAAERGAFVGLPTAAAARPSATAGAPETERASPGGRTAPEGSLAVRTGTGVVGAGANGGGPGQRATGDGHAQVLASYLKGVRDRVSRHREYPYLARRANLEGTVCLRLVVAASGRVVGVTPTCGGSHQPLVDAALASVSSAAPFPPLPEALGQRLTIDVPVVFALDQP
jgi:protein TonB